MAPKATPKAKADATPKANAEANASAQAPKFPPPASSSGKRYYVHYLRNQIGERPPFIAVGHEVSLHLMGGSWLGTGTAPKGFADLEAACNDLQSRSPGHTVTLISEVPREATGQDAPTGSGET